MFAIHRKESFLTTKCDFVSQLICFFNFKSQLDMPKRHTINWDI